MSDISLEIHHLDVHGGDATAIIVKKDGTDLYRVLIDAGAEGEGSGALKFYLESYLPGDFDLVIATHYHRDHILGFAEANIVFKKFIDIGGPGTDFTPLNGIGEAATSTFRSYVARTQMIHDPLNPSAQIKPTRIPIDFIKKGFKGQPEPKEIELAPGTGESIKLICYCANGILANGTNVLTGQKAKTINSNDLSTALILQWDDFLYFTAGDLSGDTEEGSYYNIETPLVDYLTAPGSSRGEPGPLFGKRITVLKASHHGSEHSTQERLLKKLLPDTIVVSCNWVKKVPSEFFLNRLNKYFKETNPSSCVVFTNKLKVYEIDRKKRYSPIDEMLKSQFITPENVELDSDPAKFASNLKVKCAVIRRRKKNGKLIAPPAKPERALTKPHRRNGYDIVLLKRSDEDWQQVSDTVRSTDWEWTEPWQHGLCGRDEIVTQFHEQAKEMIGWLRKDEERKEPGTPSESLGHLYIKEHFPALLPVPQVAPNELEQRWVSDMEKMLDETVKLETGSYVPKHGSRSPDEMKTINQLLLRNIHQERLQKAIKRVRDLPERWAWNGPGEAGQEPYELFGKDSLKRKPSLQHSPEERPSKKQRKE
jgi:hypothetical protein